MASNPTSKSLINFSEEQHKQKLERRHLRGTIYEYLYRASLVIAVIALTTLLIQVSNNAFGMVLSVPVRPVEDFSDVPLSELGSDELAAILVEETGSGLLNLMRDNLGSLPGVAFLDAPLAESMMGQTFPSDVDPTTDTFRDLNNDQLAAVLAANASEDQLRGWVQSEIVGEDIIGAWGWLTATLRNDTVYTEAAQILGEDIARDVLRSLDDEFTAAQLAEALTPYIPAEAAATVGEQYKQVEALLLATDWDYDRQRRDVTMRLNETRRSLTAELVNRELARELEPIIEQSLIDAGIERRAAGGIATEFSDDLARNRTVTELSSIEQRDTITYLMNPAFADVLRNDAFDGGEVYSRSWLNPFFLTQTGQGSVPELATLRVAVLGSIWVMIITMVTSFPLGVGAAIYLEEYATDNWLNNLIETNIRNLAGVPSIIYGLLGLAVFVRALAVITSGAFTEPGTPSETLNGRTVLSAGLTLSLLILPVIIINSQEAIRAVSSTIREASYGLGATKWQTISRQVLPSAVPGILTGTILAFSRAVGETAPVIVVGAASSISVDPNLFSQFTVIPIQIFRWTEESRFEYQHLAAAAIIVLMLLLIILNTTAIVLRNRYTQEK